MNGSQGGGGNCESIGKRLAPLTNPLTDPDPLIPSSQMVSKIKASDTTTTTVVMGTTKASRVKTRDNKETISSKKARA